MMRSQGGRTGEGGTESVLLGWACDETLGLLVLGCLLLAGLSLAWIWATRSRQRALADLLRQRRLARADPSARASSDRELPPVAVVLPVRNVSPERVANWRSQLASDYAGALDFVFVVEAETDPAVSAVRSLEADPPFPPRGPPRRVRLAVAGSSQRTSQKIHSQRRGAAEAGAEAEVVLFLDDDVWVHPGAVRVLVDALQARPEAFMATGYPFDLPPEGATFWSYCVMAYHLPLIVAFSQGTVTKNVWGGCMLLQADALRGDGPGAVGAAWGDGAYSDDLILASLAGSLGAPILCPAESVFPNQLSGRTGAREWWNYLHRQLYVLDTYMSPYNRRVNHFLLLCQSLASAAFALPALPAVARLLVWVLWEAPGSLGLGEGGVGGAPGRGGAEAGGGGGSCTAYPAWLAALYFALFAGAVGTIARMYRVLIDLCAALSPEWRRDQHGRIPWGKVAAALLVSNALLPLCALRVVASPDVVWAGVRYRKRRGRVTRL